jgi:hypothetical protein
VGSRIPTRAEGEAVVPRAHAVVPADQVEARNGLVSFLGNARRAGQWTLPRHLRVVATFGSVELDLREARIAEGTSEVELFAVAGNVVVIAPPGVRVECEVDTLLANVEVQGSGGGAPGAPGAPVVRIRGTAVMANVEVVLRAADDDGAPAARRALRG